jgi:Fe-S oxidoreductase
MKARWWEQSQKIAGRMVLEIQNAAPERIATDCPLAALRILERTGRPAVHPVVLLAEAYGFGDAK